MPESRAFTDEEQAALSAARRAHHNFERARAALSTASDERAQAFQEALASGLTYGELAQVFGWSRSSVQAAAQGRSRIR